MAKNSDPVAAAIRTLSLLGSGAPERRAAVELLLSEPVATAVLPRVEAACAAAASSRGDLPGREDLDGLRARLAEWAALESEKTRLQAEAESQERRLAAVAALGIIENPSRNRDVEAALDSLIIGEWDLEPGKIGAALLSALDGPWATVTEPAEAAARRLLARHLEHYAEELGIVLETMLPRLGRIPVREAGGEGRTGRLQVTYGLDLYDLHYEWPIAGTGIRKDRILVIDGEREVPILTWLHEQGQRVYCTRCGGFLDRQVERGCPAQPHRGPAE